jgi:hypothetical protein
MQRLYAALLFGLKAIYRNPSRLQFIMMWGIFSWQQMMVYTPTFTIGRLIM